MHYQVTGLADAMMDSVPLVAITGQVPRKLIGTDGFQVRRGIVECVSLCPSPSGALRRALQQCCEQLLGGH